jgi:TnpA family transposase
LRIGSPGSGFPQDFAFTILFQNCREWQSVYERAARINPETPMARRTLLSADQRTRVFGIPTEASEMAKYYVLSPEDLALIRAKRRSSNRLGFAVQLCLLRHPGQGLGFSEHPPGAMIAFVARQLRVSPSAFSEYALRDQTRREHAIELQKALGLRGFRLADWRACLNGVTTRAVRSCTTL